MEGSPVEGDAQVSSENDDNVNDDPSDSDVSDIPTQLRRANIRVNSLGWCVHDYVVADSPELGDNQLGKIICFQVCDWGEMAYVHFCRRDRRYDAWFNCEDIDWIGHNMRPEKGIRIRARDFHGMHKHTMKVRNIPSITIGDVLMKCWYFSPYPIYCHGKHLFMCGRCFRYFVDEGAYRKHIARETVKPPGREIYRKGDLSIFQIYGVEYLVECQCLSLLCKLFLDNKTLYYHDIENYAFYVLFRMHERGYELTAFFSKHLRSATHNVLSCIVVLPVYQKLGYGSVLISLAYEIAKRSDRPGGPEEPLSYLGEMSFYSFWRDEITRLLMLYGKRLVSVDLISRMTGFSRTHVKLTLDRFRLITSESEDGHLTWDWPTVTRLIGDYIAKGEKKRIDPSYLIWLPDDCWSEKHTFEPDDELCPGESDGNHQEPKPPPAPTLRFTAPPPMEYGMLRKASSDSDTS